MQGRSVDAELACTCDCGCCFHRRRSRFRLAPGWIAKLTPPAPRAVRGSSIVHDGSATLSAVQSLSYIIVVAIFIVTLLVQPFRIPSPSMEPTLLVGDFLLVNKRQAASPGGLTPLPGSAIHRKDVIVFFYPVDPSLHLVKRVIGLPGDRLRMRNGRVFINGKPLDEPYAIYTGSGEDSFRDNFPHLQTTDPDVDARWWIELHHLVDRGELLIPPGKYFVLGDNRNDSEDSRYWGLVSENSIVGEPLLVYFSLRDASDMAALPRDHGAAFRFTPGAHQGLRESIARLARWDRVLHVVR